MTSHLKSALSLARGQTSSSTNPFDSEEFVSIAHSSSNPFDDDSITFAPIQPSSSNTTTSSNLGWPKSPLPSTNSKMPLMSPLSTSSSNAKFPSSSPPQSMSSSTVSAEGRVTKMRSESKESVVSVGTASGGSSSEDEEDDQEEEEEDYGPHGAEVADDMSGRNRAVVFMEANGPTRVECKMLVSTEDGAAHYEFVGVASNRCWMRAQSRTDGLKRLNPSINVSLWVSPFLLVAHHKAWGEDDDADVSFSDVMRELDMADALEEEALTKQHTPLRVGKLRSNARQTSFQLFGPGKSMARALGPMEARPELFGLKFGGSASVLAVPVKTKHRPMKSKDYLLAKAEAKSVGRDVVRKLVGLKAGANTWIFNDEGAEVIRVARKSNEEYTCTFRDVSPAVVFALTIAIHQKNSSLLKAGQSWSSLLPRISSMRKTSQPDVISGLGN